jgi:hypothetical protein
LLLLLPLLPLLLPLLVPAVILSGAEDPEELNSPPPSGPFKQQHHLLLQLSVLLQLTQEPPFQPKLLTHL